MLAAYRNIRVLLDTVNAVDLQRSALLQLRLDAQKAPVRQRTQMPDDLDRNSGVAILDSRDVAQEVIALRWIVVQPSNRLVDSRWIDVHDGLTPDYFHACDCRPELVLQRLRGRVRLGSAVLDILLRHRLIARCAGSSLNDLESVHNPDLVWLTEFPNGSPSSSITDAGM